MTYKDQKLNCKKLPSTKTARKDRQELKLYKNYMSSVLSYLRNQWPTFYSNSDLKNYFIALSESKNYILNGKIAKNIDGEDVSIFEVDRYLESNRKEEDLIFKREVASFF